MRCYKGKCLQGILERKVMDGEESSDLGSFNNSSSDEELICQLRVAGLIVKRKVRNKSCKEDRTKILKLGIKLFHSFIHIYSTIKGGR